MNKHERDRSYYARNRFKLKLKRDSGNTQSGIYCLSNPSNKTVYIGASKNVAVRFKRHYSTSLKRWEDVCPRDDWKYDMVLSLPTCLDVSSYNYFEHIVCAWYIKQGYTLLNKYNNTFEVPREEIEPQIEYLCGFVTEDVRTRVKEMMD